jgi:hypothetical protein
MDSRSTLMIRRSPPSLEGYRCAILETSTYTNAELIAAWGYRREQIETHLAALDPTAVRRATEISRDVFADLSKYRAVAVVFLASGTRGAANVLASLEPLEPLETCVAGAVAAEAGLAGLASLASLERVAVPAALSAAFVCGPVCGLKKQNAGQAIAKRRRLAK